MIRGGQIPAEPWPHICGAEVAGEIGALGEGVVGLNVGDRVAVAPYLCCGRCEFCLAGQETTCLRADVLGTKSQGGYAEQVVAPASQIVAMPDGLSFVDAAAVTLATLTAWHMLRTQAELRPGETVLVQAAGSGVGSAAIQIARLTGAEVIATASSDAKLAKAQALGAFAGINYDTTPVAAEVRRLTGKRGVDVVVEHVGTATWADSISSLARNGRLVICGTTTGRHAEQDLWQLFAKQLRLIGSYGGTRRELADVLRLTASGALRAVVDQTYPLQGAAEAQRRLEGREQFGKLVLVPRS